jgi:hypothetical protein
MRKLVLFSIAAVVMAPSAHAQATFNGITYNEVVSSYGPLPDKPYGSSYESKLKYVANWVAKACSGTSRRDRKNCAMATQEINKGLAELQAKRAAELQPK